MWPHMRLRLYHQIASAAASATVRSPRSTIPRSHQRTLWKPSLPSASSSVNSFEPIDPVADRAAAQQFVEDRGFSPAVARGVIDQLATPDWGAETVGGLHALASKLAGAWEIGEDAGLRSLAVAVEREMARAEGRQLVTFHVKPARGLPFQCSAFEGMSLKEAAENGDDEGAALLGELLECACSVSF